MIYESIQKLIKYAERNGLITADDEYVVRNQLMEILQLSDWEENNADDRNASVEALLEPIISYAVEKGLIQDTAVYRDLFDTRSWECSRRSRTRSTQSSSAAWR